MIHLVYVSNATSEMSENELAELLEQSRERNKRLNITGMLLYVDRSFFQILEGEAADVESVYNSIVADGRNSGNIVLIQEEIDKRMFPDWSMGYKHISEEKIKELEGYNDILSQRFDPESLSGVSEKVLELIYLFRKSYV